MYYNRRGGFTLIELLVVISIIGLLSSAILVRLNESRAKARVARVHAELKEFEKAIIFLEDDTRQTVGHYPVTSASCPSSAGTNEFYLDLPKGGLAQDDPGSPFPNWNGPYISRVVRDPWNNRYIFDDDYDCSLFPETCKGVNSNDTRAIFSGGPNGSIENQYDQDNIVLTLCRR